ncbi:MAG: EthD family reductase [Bacteroidota bacterium]
MKINAFVVSILLIATIGFGQETETTAQIKEGMIKVAIMYPKGEDSTFDMDYYANKHMPMAAELYGDALKAMVIDKCLGGGAPNSPPTYMAVGYFYFEDMATFQEEMGKHSPTLRADVPNYTNVKPVLMVSQVQTAQ